MSCLLKGIFKLKKLPANQITEPLAFAVCKVELGGKVVVFKSPLGPHVLGQWPTIIARQKESDVQQNKKKLRSNCQNVILLKCTSCQDVSMTTLPANQTKKARLQIQSFAMKTAADGMAGSNIHCATSSGKLATTALFFKKICIGFVMETHSFRKPQDFIEVRC